MAEGLISCIADHLPHEHRDALQLTPEARAGVYLLCEVLYLHRNSLTQKSSKPKRLTSGRR